MTHAPAGDPVPGFALPGEEFRRLGYRIVDLAAGYLQTLPQGPVFHRMRGEERIVLMAQPLPIAAAAPENVIKAIANTILPHPMGNGHPRFFGWVNSPPAQLAVLTEMLAAAMDPSCAGGDHAAIYLEHAVIRWLTELIGLPPDGRRGGLLVSGGSMASLVALAAARHRAMAGLGRDVRADGLIDGPRLTLYMSEEAHGCIRKSLELLGLGSRSIRHVPTDGEFRLDPLRLAGMITEDRRGGLTPFCIVGTAGTVNTGAIDPLDRLADVCEMEGLWFHIDGAYGAVGILDESKAPLYAGLDRADSIALDPHKWLSVPVECGCVLVRDTEWLRECFSLVPPYLREQPGRGFANLPWFAEYGFQQTRGFRALKLWATLLQAGRDGLSLIIRRHNRLALRLAKAIDEAPDLERLAPVSLSIVCFRFRPPEQRLSAEALDLLNQRIMEGLQEQGEVFLTSTTLRGRFALRACILHYGTTEGDVDHLVTCVRRMGARLHAGPT